MTKTTIVVQHHLDSATRSAQGLRPSNEDVGLASTSFLLVADGVGGGPAGEIAADIALRAAQAVLSSPPSGTVGDRLTSVFRRAHEEASEHAERHPHHDGLATTLSLVTLEGRGDGLRAVASWVGDSPIWVCRASGQAERLGGDADSNDCLDTYIGSLRWHSPHFASTRVDVGDWLVAASDGILSLTDGDIGAVLREHRDADPVDMAQELVSLALAAGAEDNVTVALGLVTNTQVLSPTVPARAAREELPEAAVSSRPQSAGLLLLADPGAEGDGRGS